MTDASAAPGMWRRARTALAESDGLGRLTSARLLALLSEGIHQAALGGIVLFNPESATAPAAIAGGFAVMLLPYSILGPFAAAALDRWDRRVVIAFAALLRTALIIATIVLIALGAAATTAGFVILLTLSLIAIGLGRLLNTGMTAAIPRVVPDRILATTNSLLVTAGSAVTAVGGAGTFAVLAVIGAGDAAVSWTLGASMITALGGAWAVLVLPRGHLGPRDDPGAPPPVAVEAWRAFAGGLREGWQAASGRPLVWGALASIALGRAAFGIVTMLAILLLRDVDETLPFSDMGGFGLLMAVVAVGMGMAAVVAPWLMARRDRLAVLTIGSSLAAVAQLLVGPTLNVTLLILGGLFLGLGSQIVKLTGDNAMQTDVTDSRRGGVFALQDALFNASFVVAMVLVLPFVPADGHSAPLMAAAGLLYGAAAGLTAWLRARRR